MGDRGGPSSQTEGSGRLCLVEVIEPVPLSRLANLPSIDLPGSDPLGSAIAHPQNVSRHLQPEPIVARIHEDPGLDEESVTGTPEESSRTSSVASKTRSGSGISLKSTWKRGGLMR